VIIVTSSSPALSQIVLGVAYPGRSQYAKSIVKTMVNTSEKADDDFEIR
jgi:hypothetical protein